MDEGVDTGDVIVQKEIEFDSNRETLATSYQKLQTEIRELFKENWRNIKLGKCRRQEQAGKGSAHKAKDKEGLSHLLADGWNVSVSRLDEFAAEAQMSRHFWEKYHSEIEEIRNEKKA